MANSVAALDFQKASGIVHRMQECIKNIHKFAGTFVGAAETALEKSTKQKWMSDIVDIGNGIQRQCVDVSTACASSTRTCAISLTTASTPTSKRGGV